MGRATADLSFDVCPYYCTDEEAIMHLLRLEHGCPLPSNVTIDVDPYCNRPENLPDGIWYLAQSRENIDIQNGFWKPTGSPCRVFLTPPFSVWRTNLEFFEGPAPGPPKPIWMMHEFKITRDGSKPDMNVKEGSALCRVFQCSELHKTLPRGDGRNISSSPCLLTGADNHTEQGSTGANQENDNSAVDVVGAEIPPPNDAAEDLLENDFIARGDYLELWDLSIPVSSPSSSSENSSCVSLSSGGCFDSLALLRDLEQENAPEDAETKDTNCHLNVSASTRPENFVLETATESCSYAMAASRSGQSWDTEEEEEEEEEGSNNKVVGRMKRLKKKYLCFMPF